VTFAVLPASKRTKGVFVTAVKHVPAALYLGSPFGITAAPRTRTTADWRPSTWWTRPHRSP